MILKFSYILFKRHVLNKGHKKDEKDITMKKLSNESWCIDINIKWTKMLKEANYFKQKL